MLRRLNKFIVPTCALTFSSITSLDKSFDTDIANALKSDQIRRNGEELKDRGKAWNTYHKSDKLPTMIVLPESTEDVSNIMKLCNLHKVSVVPFGGGTSLEGQTIPLRDNSISIDFSHMKNVIEYNKNDLDIRVQAGIGYVELNEILKPDGLWFPLDPGPGASIGGMCACRCSGSTAVRYGSMRDNVLNITAVLSDGTVIKTGGRARKCSAGYDLARLLVGSEGTLAVITEVTLKLHGIPKVSHAFRVCFDDIRAAAATARDTLNCGVTVGRCEMMDDEMIKIVNKANSSMPHLWPEKFTLLYEIVGPSEEAVREQIEIVKKIAAKHDGSNYLISTNSSECKQMWDIRKACIWAAISEFPDREPMITDVCVPLSSLPNIMHETRVAINKTTLPCPIVAHAGDGNFHVVIMFRPDVEDDVFAAKKLANDMAIRAIELGGTCTGEHGIGMGKIHHLYRELSPETMSVMESIKHTLDPDTLLNPGKVFSAQYYNKVHSSECMDHYRK